MVTNHPEDPGDAADKDLYHPSATRRSAQIPQVSASLVLDGSTEKSHWMQNPSEFLTRLVAYSLIFQRCYDALHTELKNIDRRSRHMTHNQLNTKNEPVPFGKNLLF